MEHSFHFKRGDVELSFSGERDFVEAQAAAYLPSLLGAPPPMPQVSIEVKQDLPRVSPDFRPKRNITLADFVSMKAAVAPTDLVVVAGYYMEKYMQQESFSPDDLQTQLRELPAWDCQVVDEVLPVTVMQGYMEALNDQRFTLTYKGQTYVRDGLS
jgi:hypothetical protein